MSATTERIPLDEASDVAHRFKTLIGPWCERVAIAGSIRRRQPTVGDIEVVAVPKIETVNLTDMFGEVTGAEQRDMLHEEMEYRLRLGQVEQRPKANGTLMWGRKAKLLTFEGVNVDLFSPEAARFGWILAIRTGPADWSNAMVTPVGQRTHTGRPGMLPPLYRSREGWLTYRVSGERIETPTEQTVFDLLALEWREPWERE